MEGIRACVSVEEEKGDLRSASTYCKKGQDDELEIFT